MKYLYLDILETNQTNTGFSSYSQEYTYLTVHLWYTISKTSIILYYPEQLLVGHWLISNLTYHVFYPQCSDRQWELGTLVMFC